MPGTGSRSRITTRTACPDDLPAVLALVRQHRAEAHAEGVLTGQTPGAAAAAGFRRLLADPAHRVALAVLPAGAPGRAGAEEESVIGLAILGLDPLSAVLGVAQVTVDNLVVHREHRRCGAGAALLGAAVAYAADLGADHVVASVGGHEAERQRFFARMGFAPLTTRRIVPRQTLARTLAAWQRSGGTPPAGRPPVRRRPVARVLPLVGTAAET